MKNIKKWLIILISLLMLVMITMLLLKNKDVTSNNENKNHIEQNTVIVNDIKLVDNPIMYFTVRSCAEKYIKYLVYGDKEIIYNLIDDEYKKEFHITKENVLDYVESVYNIYEFKINKMYVQEVNSNNEIYYIKGTLREVISQFESIVYGETKDMNITIKINRESMTFTVVPFGYGGVLYE